MDPRATLIRQVLILSIRLLVTVFLLSPLVAESSSQSVGATGYRLGPNDVIRIQVFGEDDLSVESKIDGDGNIRLPLLGTVTVGGKTITELQGTLTERLAAGYVRNPRVTIHIVKHRNFYLSGGVKSPGGYSYEEGLNVQKAISLAGGLTEKSERGALHILRRIGGQEETLPVQLDTLVLPDDIIVVAEGQKFFISGEVKTPGRYLYEKGLSANKALGLAGGRTDKAEKNTVKVTRLTSGLAETFALSPDAEVLPDDILVVEPEHHKFYASGEVKTPGGYPYQESLTVHRAVAMAGGLTEKAERGALHILRRVGGQEETLPVQLDTLVLPDDIIVVAEARRFYVSGEVRTPGRYLYENGMTAHKAVSMAGGWTEKSEKGTILVTRVSDSVAHTMEIALDAPLLPDDFVVVPQLKKIYVNGEVKRAGDFPYGRGLTVHQAITMAGGFTDKAAENSTKVLRKINGQEQSIQVNLDTVILPEDIVVVPRSFF